MDGRLDHQTDVKCIYSTFIGRNEENRHITAQNILNANNFILKNTVGSNYVYLTLGKIKKQQPPGAKMK